MIGMHRAKLHLTTLIFLAICVVDAHAVTLEKEVGIEEGDEFKFKVSELSGVYADMAEEEGSKFVLQIEELPDAGDIGKVAITIDDNENIETLDYTCVGVSYVLYTSWDYFEQVCIAAGFQVDNGDDEFEVTLSLTTATIDPQVVATAEYHVIYEKKTGVAIEYGMSMETEQFNGEFKIVRKVGFLGLPGFTIPWVLLALPVPIIARSYMRRR